MDYSLRTGQAYVHWIKRFILSMISGTRAIVSAAEVEAFQTELSALDSKKRYEDVPFENPKRQYSQSYRIPDNRYAVSGMTIVFLSVIARY